MKKSNISTILPGVNNLVICGGSIEKKNSQHLTLLTSQSVTVNLVQPGLILSKSHPFLGASLDSIVINVDNLETWGVEIKCPSSKLNEGINVLKDKKFYLKNQMGRFS